jgi:hypothetical protein
MQRKAPPRRGSVSGKHVAEGDALEPYPNRRPSSTRGLRSGARNDRDHDCGCEQTICYDMSNRSRRNRLRASIRPAFLMQ